jgi:hypothetical protein
VTRAHGTVSCYTGGCRCTECRQASTEAARVKRRAKAEQRWGVATPSYVDAEPVREHVRELTAAGMGWARVEHAAGVSSGTVGRLLYSENGYPPSRRIRTESAQRILAVRLDLADMARVDATGTRRRLQALIASGWSHRTLARQLGAGVNMVHRAIRAEMVNAATARTVAALYGRLWDVPPPTDTPTARTTALRARRLAASRGWAPPMAWDDADIDDPEARPHGYRRPAHQSATTT